MSKLVSSETRQVQKFSTKLTRLHWYHTRDTKEEIEFLQKKIQVGVELGQAQLKLGFALNEQKFLW